MSTPAQTKAHNALNTYLAASRGQSLRPERQRRARIAFLETIETIVTEQAAAATANTRAALARTDRDKIAAIADHMHALDQLAAAKTSANGWADRVALLNAELTEARETIASLQGELAITRGAQPLADVLRTTAIPEWSPKAAEPTAAPSATPGVAVNRVRTAAKPRKAPPASRTKGGTSQAGTDAPGDAK